ncbi:MAG: VacJ family lipoprotein [Oceanospirillaceae bacterium]
MSKVRIAILSVIVLFSFAVQASDNIDPLEKVNRKVHGFNDVLDTVALKPLAKGYKAVTPDIVEAGVGNFFANIRDVGTMVNNVLQFKFEDAGVDLARVAFNTTIGLGGIIDVSSAMGLEKHAEDFGQTLGAWGVPAGPYLVMPFFGPSSLRDAPASFVPLDAWRYVDDVRTRNVGYSVRLVDDRAGLFNAEALVSGDEYIFIRDAYLGLRAQAVKDGAIDEAFNEDDF